MLYNIFPTPKKAFFSQFQLLIPKNDNILPNPWNYIKKTLFSKMIQSGKSF